MNLTNTSTSVRTRSSLHRSALHRGRGYRPKGYRPDRHDNGGSAQGVADCSKAPSQLYISGSLTELALGALDHLLWRHRHANPNAWSTAAMTAVLLGGSAPFCGVVANVLGGINLAAAGDSPCTARCGCTASGCQLQTRARLDLQRVRGADHHGKSPFWRCGRVPRWLAVLFALGFELAEQTASVGIAKGVLQMAPFALAMVLLLSSASGERPTQLRQSVTITSRRSRTA